MVGVAGEGLFMGIDGGGTRCRARLADAAGRTLGQGTGGPSNIRLGPAVALGAVLEAARAAIESAGLPAEAIGRVHAGMGLAGAGQAKDRAAFLAAPHPFASVTVETDAYAAWLGAFGGADGAILIVGTGSCGLAVVGGKRHNVGGWGAEVSDEGSGAIIGREIVRRAIWCFDGVLPESRLANAVLERFGFDPQKIVDWAPTARPADFAAIAPLAFEHAAARDDLAVAIVSEAATQLARMADRMLDLGAPSIAMVGGIAAAIAPWLPPPIAARLVEPQGDAMAGALLMARQPAGMAAEA